jgi:GTP cyclohydrolase I
VTRKSHVTFWTVATLSFDKEEDIRMTTFRGRPAIQEYGDEIEDERPDDPRTCLVAARFKGVMEALGLDLADPNLRDTPRRVARAYRELFAGLQPGAEPELRTFPNTEGYSRAVGVSDIAFQSLCAHHFLPFVGTAHVAYIPGPRVVGLSKLARVVDYYSRRPQIQERLTEQIAQLVDQKLSPSGVMVVVEARHFCMEMRGVMKPGATTTTSAVRGTFAVDEQARRECLEMLSRGMANRRARAD